MAAERSINIAILAMGGEGGGVLADWIAELAHANGYIAQATSVPGVAQRTGATIYYLELFPRAAIAAAGKQPVLALMPSPGDVDIVIASELMEAGRAVQRGFVTPDRTTLITSTHRVYAIAERIALSDGRVDEKALREGITLVAKRLVAFDMVAIAEASSSVISAVMFGALAGSQALPFPRAAYEAAIRAGDASAQTSLNAFAAGFDAARSGPDSSSAPTPLSPGPAVHPELQAVLAEAERTYAGPALDLIRHGILRTADYQDLDYARRYLALLSPVSELERDQGNGGLRLLAETARQLALAMTYEDTIRVAELKIRPARLARVREEVKLGEGQLLDVAEYLHPRLQEIADTLPASLGSWLLRTSWAHTLVERLTASGRVVKTTSLRGFLTLYAVAALKRWRPRSLRFATEHADIARWLDLVRRTAKRDYKLAVEIAEARSLVKGYGDTHERGRARFARLMDAVPRLYGRPDAASALKRLRMAALADESGAALDEALRELAKTQLVIPEAERGEAVGNP